GSKAGMRARLARQLHFSGANVLSPVRVSSLRIAGWLSSTIQTGVSDQGRVKAGSANPANCHLSCGGPGSRGDQSVSGSRINRRVAQITGSAFCWIGLHRVRTDRLLESAERGAPFNLLLDGTTLPTRHTTAHDSHSPLAPDDPTVVVADPGGRSDCRTLCPPFCRDVD